MTGLKASFKFDEGVDFDFSETLKTVLDCFCLLKAGGKVWKTFENYTLAPQPVQKKLKVQTKYFT